MHHAFPRTRAVFALVALAQLTAAAEAPPPTEEVVIWGKRAESPSAAVLEAGVAEVELLERAEVEALPVTSLDELLATLPGVRTQARVQGEEAAISIEGMPPEHTKILVDGERYSGEIGGADDLRDTPTLFVRRVSIRRGAQGLRYGSDSAGGVVEIDTLRGLEVGEAATFEAAGGTDSAFVGGLHARAALGAQQLAITALQDEIAGFDPPPGETQNRAGGAESRRLSRDVYVTWNRAMGAGSTWFADVGFRREDEDFVPVGGGVGSRRDQERWRATLGNTWSVSEGTSLRSSLALFQRDVASNVGRNFAIDEREWDLDIALRRQQAGRFGAHEIEIGLDAQRGAFALEEGSLPAYLEGVVTPGDVSARVIGGGIYLIDEIQLGERISIELGAREELSSEFGSAFVAQAGVVATPFVAANRRRLETFRLRASVGKNHRAPSLRDLYQPEAPQLGGAYFLAGNRALEPEQTLGFRVGLDWAPESWLALNATLFHNTIRDGIRSVRARTLAIPTGEYVEVPVLADDRLVGLWRICRAIDFSLPDCAALIGVPVERVPITRPADVFVKTNLDRIETRGLELALQLRPRSGLALDFAYTLLDTSVRDGESAQLRVLPNQPKHQLDGRLRVHVPRLGTTLALIARYRGASVTETSGTGLVSFSNPDALSDPSLLVGARVTQPIGQRLELFFDVDNLTDQRVQDSYAIRGRTVFGGMRVRFGADRREEETTW